MASARCRAPTSPISLSSRYTFSRAGSEPISSATILPPSAVSAFPPRCSVRSRSHLASVGRRVARPSSCRSLRERWRSESKGSEGRMSAMSCAPAGPRSHPSRWSWRSDGDSIRDFAKMLSWSSVKQFSPRSRSVKRQHERMASASTVVPTQHPPIPQSVSRKTSRLRYTLFHNPRAMCATPSDPMWLCPKSTASSPENLESAVAKIAAPPSSMSHCESRRSVKLRGRESASGVDMSSVSSRSASKSSDLRRLQNGSVLHSARRPFSPRCAPSISKNSSSGKQRNAQARATGA
mmetsp:Transcript_716/g.1384  ORF Transcript_716/g.1384 Transcript_716/m.1384 type:complete len:293 (+) Transcript_716:223-1101(+)